MPFNTITYKLYEALSYSFRMFLIALQCLVEHSATNNEYRQGNINTMFNSLNMQYALYCLFNSRLMKFVYLWKISKDNLSLIPESEG